MVAIQPAVSDEDISTAARVATELLRGGREADARAVMRLVVQAEEVRSGHPADEDVTLADLAAGERADADILAGRIIPHRIVMQGRGAVEEYRRHRDSGSLDPATAAEIAAAVSEYRTIRLARGTLD